MATDNEMTIKEHYPFLGRMRNSAEYGIRADAKLG
jgi:hypothetical protein